MLYGLTISNQSIAISNFSFACPEPPKQYLFFVLFSYIPHLLQLLISQSTTFIMTKIVFSLWMVKHFACNGYLEITVVYEEMIEKEAVQ